MKVESVFLGLLLFLHLVWFIPVPYIHGQWLHLYPEPNCRGYLSLVFFGGEEGSRWCFLE